MKLGTKARIAEGTLSLLTVVVAIFLLGVLVLVLCVGLQINPFKETTTSFLMSSFVGLIGIASVLVLLNVATNVSLIADAKVTELKIEPEGSSLKKWAVAFFGAALISVSLVFVGTYFSKEKYSRLVQSQADEVLDENHSALEEISQRLASGKLEDYRRINDIRLFLQNQRSGLPQLTVIYSQIFSGKLAFYRVNEYFSQDSREQTYAPTYFACTPNLDCEYLKQFFSGQKVDKLRKYTFREDEFYIYVPFVGNEARFVLLFERRNNYGKIGS